MEQLDPQLRPAPDAPRHAADRGRDGHGRSRDGDDVRRRRIDRARRVADYSGQFNDAFAAQTVEQTTPTITHTFPEAGAYSTGVAVFNPDGLSTGTGGIVTTGQNGFTPAFTVSTDGAGGRTAHFSALTTVSRKPVINYLREFGDGSNGSGPTPSHIYSRPGTYTVKAVLFSGIGSAFPDDGAGPVYAQQVTVGNR